MAALIYDQDENDDDTCDQAEDSLTSIENELSRSMEFCERVLGTIKRRPELESLLSPVADKLRRQITAAKNDVSEARRLLQRIASPYGDAAKFDRVLARFSAKAREIRRHAADVRETHILMAEMLADVAAQVDRLREPGDE